MHAPEPISVLTSYFIGLEAVLARLSPLEGKAMFRTAGDFATGLLRRAHDGILQGELQAAQREQGGVLRKHFHDGWPTITVPGHLDLVLPRQDWLDWAEHQKSVLEQYFKKTPVADSLHHHMEAVFEGLEVIGRHQGGVRRMTALRDMRSKTRDQRFNFDLNMR
jgi:hypothetical protein